ncbi:unnamed protein product [Trichogramma brassicae]|uniref:Uncharacterized protein n=1 Tax=Trichogramma brassicae TaxID=86971 RepID=A0A6H5I8V6_9HYME|nr:unnamed protein product [Trichogramma brassicae]
MYTRCFQGKGLWPVMQNTHASDIFYPFACYGWIFTSGEYRNAFTQIRHYLIVQRGRFCWASWKVRFLDRPLRIRSMVSSRLLSRRRFSSSMVITSASRPVAPGFSMIALFKGLSSIALWSKLMSLDPARSLGTSTHTHTESVLARATISPIYSAERWPRCLMGVVPPARRSSPHLQHANRRSTHGYRKEDQLQRRADSQSGPDAAIGGTEASDISLKMRCPYVVAFLVLCCGAIVSQAQFNPQDGVTDQPWSWQSRVPSYNDQTYKEQQQQQQQQSDYPERDWDRPNNRPDWNRDKDSNSIFTYRPTASQNENIIIKEA